MTTVAIWNFEFPEKQVQAGATFLIAKENGHSCFGKLLVSLKAFRFGFFLKWPKTDVRIGASRVTFSVCYRLLRSNLFIWFPCPCCYGAWKLLREISKNNNKKWKFHNASTTWCQLHNRNLFDCKDTNRFKTNIFFVIFCAF